MKSSKTLLFSKDLYFLFISTRHISVGIFLLSSYTYSHPSGMNGRLILLAHLLWIKIVAFFRIDLGPTKKSYYCCALNEGVADCLMQIWLKWREVAILHDREGDNVVWKRGKDAGV